MTDYVGFRAAQLAKKITDKWKSGPQNVGKEIAIALQLERGYGLIEGVEYSLGAIRTSLDKRKEELSEAQIQPLVLAMQDIEATVRGLVKMTKDTEQAGNE